MAPFVLLERERRRIKEKVRTKRIEKK